MSLKKRSLVAVLLVVPAVSFLVAPARVEAGPFEALAFQDAEVQSAIVGRVEGFASAGRGERPLPGVLVLLSQGGEVFGEAVTDEQGAYQFVGLEPGTYEVALDDATLPPEYRVDPPLSNVVELPGNVEFEQNFRIEEIGVQRPGLNPPGVPSVRLNASASALTEGGSVTFTVTFEPSIEAVEYLYFFGDGRQERSLRPQAVHVYERSGVFQAYVQLAQNGDPFAESPQITLAVAPNEAVDPEAPRPITIDILAEPQSAEAGEPVVFTARGAPDAPAVEYRFHFGDAAPGAWLRSRSGWPRS